MQAIIEHASPDQVENAWSNAQAFPSTDATKVRYDRNGVRMDRDKFGDLKDPFGWVLVRDDRDNIEAVNQFSRFPADARRQINTLRMI